MIFICNTLNNHAILEHDLARHQPTGLISLERNNALLQFVCTTSTVSKLMGALEFQKMWLLKA